MAKKHKQRTSSKSQQTYKLLEAVKYILDASDKISVSLQEAVKSTKQIKGNVVKICGNIQDIITVIKELLEQANELKENDIKRLNDLSNIINQVFLSLNAAAVELRHVGDATELEALIDINKKLMFRSYLQDMAYCNVANLIDSSVLKDWEPNNNNLQKIISAKNILIEIGVELEAIDSILQKANNLHQNILSYLPTQEQIDIVLYSLNDVAKLLNEFNEELSQYNLSNLPRELNDVTEAIDSIKGIIDIITEMKIVRSIIQIELLNATISLLGPLFKRVNDLMSSTDLQGKSQNMSHLIDTFKVLKEIFASIKSIDTLMVGMKVKLITGAVDKLEPLIVKLIKISKIRDLKDGSKKMESVKALIKSFASVIVALMLLAPLSAAFVLLSPIIVLMVGAAAVIVWAVVKFISFAVNPRTVKSIIGIIALIGLIALIAIGLIALSLMADSVIKSFPNILKLMLGITLFAVAFAAFGAVMSLASGFMVMGLAGIALVGLAVLALLVITAALYLITQIDIDGEKVRDKVQQVLSLAGLIALWVFSPLEDENQKETDKPDPGILSLLGTGIARLVGSLLGSAVLVSAVVSVGAILLIAGMLKLVGMIDLDVDKIRDNVRSILDTCNDIIYSIFAPDTNDKHESTRGILTGLVDMFLPELSPVLAAIFSAATLAVTIISIASVLAIAGMLRLLQNLDLDPNKVLQNVRVVMSTCREIISSMFAPDEENEDESGRGVFRSLISWVVGKDVSALLDAVFSMAYLAVMVIAATALLGVAKILSSIANLDASVFTKAKENIGIVMDVMDYLRQCIFGRDEEGSKPSSRGTLMNIVAWVAGEGVAKTLEGILMIGNMATMYFAVYLLAGLAKSLEEISKVDASELGAAKTNALEIISTATGLLDLIINGDYQLPKAKDAGLLKKLLTAFVPDDLVAIADALASIGKLSVMQLAVGAVTRLAVDLQALTEVEYNSTNVGTNVKGILEEAHSIMKQLLSDFDDFDSDKLEDIVPLMNGVNATINGISNLAVNLNKLVDINLAGMDTASQKAIETFNQSKKIIASVIDGAGDISELTWTKLFRQQVQYEQITSMLKVAVNPMIGEMEVTTSEINKLSSNIVKTSSVSEEQLASATRIAEKSVQSIRSLITRTMLSNDSEDVIEVLNTRKLEVKALTEIVSHGSDAMEQLNKLISTHLQSNDFDEGVITAKAHSYKTSLLEFKQILEMADGINPNVELVRSNADLMDRLSQTVGSFVRVTDADVANSRKLTENYGKFLTTVDKMDHTKLNATAWMMKYWASISRDLRGDFEGLSRTVNQNIMPMLDRLNKTMEEVTKCQNEIIKDLTEPIDLTGGGSLSGSNYPDSSSSSYTPAGGPAGSYEGGASGSSDGSTSASGGVGNTSTQASYNTTNTPQPRPSARPKTSKMNDIEPEIGKKYLVEFAKITDA